MANQRRESVSYRVFRAQPNLAEGLLGVSREGGGDLERRIAAGLARIADTFGQKADRQAALAGERDGRRAAMAGAPGQFSVEGGEETTASINGQAGHVRGARGGVRAKVPPEQLRNMIADAAVRHGVDPDALTQIAGIESSFNPLARNPKSSAGGLFQLIDGTARQYGLTDKFDPAQASDAAARLARDNAKFLTEKLGRAPTAGELYLAHQQGAGGAAKILANPSARAVDVVGRDAVLLNGGKESMTAGEFAALWTSKVSGSASYKAMPEPSSVGPVEVVPVDRPVTMTPGKAGGFKPTGADTIYGRAYDVAGTRTYREELELTMLADQDAVFEAYKDDPAKLRKAYDELLVAHSKDHLFEEIEADYSLAFRKRAMGKIEQAENRAREKRLVADRSAFIDRVQEFENTKSRLLAGLDLNSDAGEAELAALQGTIDQHYDSAVARGIISADDAARAQKAGRSDLMTTFYTRQAATKTAAEIRAMREEMTRDYAAGKLDGVGADDWERISSGLVAAEKARVTQDEKANADLQKRGEDLAKRVARGLPVSADELARFQLDAKTAPRGAEIVTSTLSRLKVSEAIRTLPIGEVEKKLPSLLGEGAGPDDLDFARKAVADHRKALGTDPIGVAERFGILPPSAGLPLEGDVDPEQVSLAFAERVNQADAAARHFGVTPRYFRPGEAEMIEAAVKADPERGLSIAAGLVDAADRNAPRLLAELGETAPALSGAGEIVALGGDMNAARDLMAGYGPSPTGKAYPDMDMKKRLPEALKIAGPALASSPDQVRRLDAQAAAITRKRLFEAGIDPKSEDAKPVYRQALNEAAGASYVAGVQYGGFGSYDAGLFYREKPVLVAPSIRADRFSDVLGALTDADLGGVTAKNGRAWTAADIKKSVPVAVKGGYVFAQGDPQSANPMFIADDKGNPLLLDIANMASLKARVPEAFR